MPLAGQVTWQHMPTGYSEDRRWSSSEIKGPIAQLVERAPDKGEVDSSILSRPTKSQVKRPGDLVDKLISFECFRSCGAGR